MTRSELLLLLLISGMGSMAASVLMGYVGMGIPMEYLLIAGALVPLSSIIVSKLLIPEVNKEAVVENVVIDRKGGNIWSIITTKNKKAYLRYAFLLFSYCNISSHYFM